jgi:hypothetical protein
MLRLRLLIATPNALSSGKVKRGFGGIVGCWIRAVLTVINILNRVASELITKVDRYLFVRESDPNPARQQFDDSSELPAARF